MEFKVNGTQCSKIYLLSEGIYPKTALIVRFVLNPTEKAESYYASGQEGERNDVEKGFELLQVKFHLLALLSRLWSRNIVKNTMNTLSLYTNGS